MQGKNFTGSMKEFYYNPKVPADPNDGVTEEQRNQLQLIKRLIS